MSDFQVDLSKSDSRFLEQEQDLIDRHRMEKEELLQDCKVHVDFITLKALVFKCALQTWYMYMYLTNVLYNISENFGR